ncbi:nucleoside recognition domain-containing protein [Desulfoscipio sp. XC116]|uniref:nucleoside recognition domain-containing protein n=1 Tax=Desulfoscipio sp. XC116 TaxID=3144975 RepID=UPI00325B6172
MAFAYEAATGIGNNVRIMVSIVIPIMVMLELAKDMQILDRMANWMASPLKIFGFSPKAAFPLLVGIIFGIAYGAGVLIEEARSGRLNWKDLFLINVFLSICHAVVEDTALFMAVGADGLIILLGRFMAAVLLTFLISRTAWLERENLKRSVKEVSC